MLPLRLTEMLKFEKIGLVHNVVSAKSKMAVLVNESAKKKQ